MGDASAGDLRSDPLFADFLQVSYTQKVFWSSHHHSRGVQGAVNLQRFMEHF